MTILPPPPRQSPHVCDTPSSLICRNSDRLPPGPLDGTLWECPSCGRWWRYHYLDTCWDYYEWRPVRWYDIPARRRIAAHETAKMHYRVPQYRGRPPLVGLPPQPETRTSMGTNDPMTQEQLDAIRGRLDCGTPTTSDVSALLAEVERLRALTTVDDAMLERATRAFGAATAQVSSVPLGMSDDTFMDSVGLQHLHAIRAALDAALGTGGTA